MHLRVHGLNDDVDELFTQIREAHEGWDGVTEPVRVRSKNSSVATS